MEEWVSGLNHTVANCTTGNPVREFESLLFRQFLIEFCFIVFKVNETIFYYYAI